MCDREAGLVELLKKEVKTHSHAVSSLSEEKNRTIYRNVSVYKTLAGLFHNSNVF